MQWGGDEPLCGVRKSEISKNVELRQPRFLNFDILIGFLLNDFSKISKNRQNSTFRRLRSRNESLAGCCT